MELVSIYEPVDQVVFLILKNTSNSLAHFPHDLSEMI